MARRPHEYVLKLLCLSGCSCLCCCLKFCLESLESSVSRDVQGCTCFRSEVDTLSRIHIKKRSLLEHESDTLCLCKVGNSCLSLLLDRSLKVLLELLKLYLKALLGLLEA